MTEDQFRCLALALPEATESAHHGHPDFRVGGKVFATLGYPARGYGMVKLTPAQQRSFAGAAPNVFKPVAGGWGRRGCTNVHLSKASKAALLPAMVAAWRNVAPKRLAADFEA
jgi:hypothetical protein